QDAEVGVDGEGGPDLLPAEDEATVDRSRRRRQRRQVRPRARLGEQLTPAHLAEQGRDDPALLLLRRAVLEQRGQRPRTHLEVRALDPRSSQLLRDDELLQRRSSPAGGRRQVRLQPATEAEL